MKGNRWIHFMLLGFETECGKTDFKTLRSEDKQKVTCKNCIEKMKQKYWYCKEHGFINDENVTYEETCGFCGRTALV